MKKLRLKIIKFLLKQKIEFFAFENGIVVKTKNKNICVIEIRNIDFVLVNDYLEFDFKQLKKFITHTI